MVPRAGGIRADGFADEVVAHQCRFVGKPPGDFFPECHGAVAIMPFLVQEGFGGGGVSVVQINYGVEGAEDSVTALEELLNSLLVNEP